jgi:hypothetical protein
MRVKSNIVQVRYKREERGNKQRGYRITRIKFRKKDIMRMKVSLMKKTRLINRRV